MHDLTDEPTIEEDMRNAVHEMMFGPDEEAPESAPDSDMGPISDSEWMDEETAS